MTPTVPVPDSGAGGFEPGAEVRVRQLDDRDWEVLAGFVYRTPSTSISVPTGLRTDFASVPRVFAWLLPRYGRYTLSAILHDHLWQDLAPAGVVTMRDADRIFRDALASQGVSILRRWLMWTAVRYAALVRPNGREDWLSDAPAIALVTVLAAPVVLPPALVVGVGLAAFYLADLLVWTSAQVLGRARAPRPRLSWRL